MSRRKRVRTIIVAALCVVGVGLLLMWNTMKNPDGLGQPALSGVVEAHELALNWLFANVRDKGLFSYNYNPENNASTNKNNAIRQLMASRILAEASRGNPELLEVHKKNLAFLMEFWYQEADEFGTTIGYVYYSNKSKLGANAMLLRVLVASPLFNEYQLQAERVARGILLLQDEDGSFRAWYKEPDYEYDEDYLLTFYSGEALLGLVEYYEKTKQQQYLDAAVLSANFYIDKYAVHLKENYYPAYVPWHTIALNKLYKITYEEKYADATFTMNDKLLEIQDTTNVVGRFYNPEIPQYGSPHASSDAVYTEGLAYAYEIAGMVEDRQRQETYARAIEIGVQNLLSLQYTEEIENGIAVDPARYVGAFKVRVDSPWIRVDATQHTIDAFEKVIQVLGKN